MPRPKRHRKIGKPPGLNGYKPHGGRMRKEVVQLYFEEYEALKLADYDGYAQAEAAEIMEVSRPTFTRIYDRALKKIARAFVEHLEIVFEGGKVTLDDDSWFRCEACSFVFKMPGRGNQIQECPVCRSANIHEEEETEEAGKYPQSDGWCVCTKCNHQVKHQPGKPCRETYCPECNSRMRRL